MDFIPDPSKLFFQADNVRRSIISAYWIFIILALPLWWSTTSIERLSLPSSQVTSNAQKRLQIPVRLAIDVGPDSPSVASQLQDFLNRRIEQAPERWNGLDVQVSNSSAVNGTYIIHSGKVPVLSDRTLVYPIEAQTTSGIIDVLSDLIAPYLSTSEPEHRVAQYSPRYRLSFSLLNEDAAAGIAFSKWDVSTAILRHISPILERLSVLHNFTLESQVQFHAPLAFNPQQLDNALGITPEDLTVFVNSAEWTLSSSASNDPVLHFVLFIPSAERRPVHILDHKGDITPSNAFLLPQWGGIVIHNPSSQNNHTESELSSTDLDTIFSAFSSHLLSLLGVPLLPPNIQKVFSNDILTDWQLDALLRYRALNNAQSSKDTLESIVKLVDQIENMPVGQDVRDDIQNTLIALENMYDASTMSLIETLRHSARAFTLSSRAFFNPGMLALLYFPAEHKYAVYTPMFASAVIPLFVAALRELWAWRRERKQNTSTTDSRTENK